MTAPTVAAQSIEWKDAGRIDIPIPAHQIDDVIVAIVGRQGDYAVHGDLTNLSGDPSWAHKFQVDCETDTIGFEVWWRRATVALGAGVVNASFGPTTQGSSHSIVLVVRGAEPISDPFDVTASLCATDTTLPAANVDIPSLTTTVAECLAVHSIVTRRVSGNAGMADLSGWTNGTLSSFGEAWNESNGAGTDGSIGGTTGVMDAAGSTGVVTVSLSDTYHAAAVSFAIKPGERQVWTVGSVRW